MNKYIFTSHDDPNSRRLKIILPTENNKNIDKNNLIIFDLIKTNYIHCFSYSRDGDEGNILGPAEESQNYNKVNLIMNNDSNMYKNVFNQGQQIYNKKKITHYFEFNFGNNIISNVSKYIIIFELQREKKCVNIKITDVLKNKNELKIDYYKKCDDDLIKECSNKLRAQVIIYLIEKCLYYEFNKINKINNKMIYCKINILRHSATNKVNKHIINNEEINHNKKYYEGYNVHIYDN